ncbi:hypothetical protein [Photobacterium carnosum]|uniref:hypothetical protein n=1 Tax=Photobacterium carnosum TaxID=2023717 RepID=UPI001E2FF64E|nr:hypothetical protein [Photobacterium carnosum]MCD9530391.1 hypothetical protein [Photobacterium carnosum]MCF2153177.1 hypothetical protein [Photobacterium carnosum]MCF2214937.1 hypothetical protein [Photobacterium carnosum]
MNNLNFWLESFDKLRVERNPFKAHIIANLLNEHEQNQYAVLQAAFVLANGAINQDQERLYGFWLAAINNNLSLSNVITQAQAVDLDALRDGINLLEEKGLIEHFLVDTLVFIRLAGSLTDNLKTILGEWCQLLSLNEAPLNDVIALTDHILGVEDPKVVKLTPTMELLLINQIWQEFYVKPLTKEMLTNSINGGVWSVENTISTECDINLNNTVVMFKNTATIKQINSKLTLTNVGLINPVFDLYNVAMSFEQVVAVGGFDKEQKITSFTSNSTPDFSIKKSKFELINARCFKFKDEESKGLFDTTVFENCGNEYLNGGVANYGQGIKFKNCNFLNCNALIGGVIYCKTILDSSIVSCKIDNCNSITICDNINIGCIYSYTYIKSAAGLIIDSIINSNVSFYEGEFFSYYHKERLFVNSKLLAKFNYYNIYTHEDDDYRTVLDSSSIELSDVKYAFDKNQNLSEMPTWSNN